MENTASLTLPVLATKDIICSSNMCLPFVLCYRRPCKWADVRIEGCI